MSGLDGDIAVGHLLVIAHGLRSDNGENPEYDRALVELCASAIGTEDKGWVARGILAGASPLHAAFDGVPL